VYGLVRPRYSPVQIAAETANISNGSKVFVPSSQFPFSLSKTRSVGQPVSEPNVRGWITTLGPVPLVVGVVVDVVGIIPEVPEAPVEAAVGVAEAAGSDIVNEQRGNSR
jgi:hypothetical protein